MRSVLQNGVTRCFVVGSAARSLIVLGTLAAAGGNAFAQTPFSFSGSVLVVDRAGADCDSVSAQVGELHTSVFRPVQGGVSFASLSWLQNQVALRINPQGGGDFQASGTYFAVMFAARGGLVEYTGTYTAFRIKPSSPTSTAPVLDISGKIRNFRNAGNCTVTFKGGYVLKP